MKPKNGALAQLTTLLPSLKDAERKLAQYILRYPHKVIYSSVQEVARHAGGSEASLVRLCQRAGWKGFQEFKVVLAADTATPEDVISQNLAKGDQEEDIVNKVTHCTLQGLRNSKKVLNIRSLKRAVDYMCKARHVEFYGVGMSGLTAMDAKNRFYRIGISCEASTDPHFQKMSAARLSQRDLAFGISYSGCSKETLEVLALARKRGAKVIALTNVGQSPISKLAHVVLLTSVRESPLATGSLESKIAQLHIINILYTAVAMRMRPEVLRESIKDVEVLSTLREEL